MAWLKAEVAGRGGVVSLVVFASRTQLTSFAGMRSSHTAIADPIAMASKSNKLVMKDSGNNQVHLSTFEAAVNFLDNWVVARSIELKGRIKFLSSGFKGFVPLSSSGKRLM